MMPSLVLKAHTTKCNKSNCSNKCKCSYNEDEISVTECSDSICEDDLSLPSSTLQGDDDEAGEDSTRSKSKSKNSCFSKRNIPLKSALTISQLPPKDQVYALKRLHKPSSGGTEDDLKLRRAGEKDLLLEAGILAQLPNHVNIIQLRALSVDFWKAPGSGFLIIDQLTETLNDRLQRWRRPAIITAGPLSKTLPFYKPTAKLHRRQQEQSSRIQQSALGIACAMEFLHKHKVIYRDLKPQNVGFDAAGTVQLFDFGLARVHCEGARLLTGFTGSARYMAPEVARRDDYSFPADVHAFAILLWEISTLEKAFCKTATMQQLVQQVVHRHKRPSLNKVASPIIRELLNVSWHRDSDMRPSFALVVKQLELEGQAVRAL
jgi:serine/threonine protein kinase